MKTSFNILSTKKLDEDEEQPDAPSEDLPSSKKTKVTVQPTSAVEAKKPRSHGNSILSFFKPVGESKKASPIEKKIDTEPPTPSLIPPPSTTMPKAVNPVSAESESPISDVPDLREIKTASSKHTEEPSNGSPVDEAEVQEFEDEHEAR